MSIHGRNLAADGRCGPWPAARAGPVRQVGGVGEAGQLQLPVEAAVGSKPRLLLGHDQPVQLGPGVVASIPSALSPTSGTRAGCRRCGSCAGD